MLKVDPVYIACFIYCYDVWFYLSRVLMHNFTFHFHNYHPCINYYSYKYQYYYQIMCIQCLGFIVPLIYIDQQPIHVLLSILIISLRGRLRQNERFVWLMGNHYILHHKYPKYNFGEYWLDRGFGTDYPDKDEYVYGYCL